MPPINDIRLDKGIHFLASGLGIVDIPRSEFPLCTSADELSEALTAILQHKFEMAVPFSQLTPDNVVFHNGKLDPGMYVRVIAAEKHLVYAPFWVAVHVYSLDPMNYTIYFANVTEPMPAASALSSGEVWW